MHLSVHPYVQPEILCAQLLHSLMDFVHTHTQWPTWHEDDCKTGFCDAASFTWVMGLCHGRGGASVSYRHISSYIISLAVVWGSCPDDIKWAPTSIKCLTRVVIKEYNVVKTMW